MKLFLTQTHFLKPSIIVYSSNLFFKQLIKDIKVQKRRTPETMNCVTNEDIIQVMKRYINRNIISKSLEL